MSTYNEADIFSAAGLPAREQVTEWYKIKSEIGNKVTGTFLGWWLTPANDRVDKDQVGFAVKVSEGRVLGISLADTAYIRSRLEPSLPGDIVGVRYEGDKDTGKPQPAKIVKFYNPALEERRAKGVMKMNAPTVSTEAEEDEDVPF